MAEADKNMRDMTDAIYKIVPTSLWRVAAETGVFAGSPVDLQDGFIHFSTATQVAETARRHFSGMRDLLLVKVNVETLGSALKFEPSRGGEFFPHLYGSLPLTAVEWIKPLLLADDGAHLFPPL